MQEIFDLLTELFVDFDIYLLGRDLLLGYTLKDLDFTTNATPEDIMEILADYKPYRKNEAFPTVCALVNGIELEISTMHRRSRDTRKEATFEYTTSLVEDASRRDFTVNAIYYDIKQKVFIDPFDGKNDYQGRLLRAINEQNFADDPLRLLRAVRFAVRLNLDLDIILRGILWNYRDRLEFIAKERIQEELVKMANEGQFHRCIEHMERYGLLDVILPEYLSLTELPYNHRYHSANGWEHTKRVLFALDVMRASYQVKIAGLLHDIGKIGTTNWESLNAIDHEYYSKFFATRWLHKFKFSRADVRSIGQLIELHMTKIHDGVPKKVVNSNIGLLYHKQVNIEGFCQMATADYYGKKYGDTMRELDILFLETEMIGKMKLFNPILGKDLAITPKEISERIPKHLVSEAIEYVIKKVNRSRQANNIHDIGLMIERYID
jgi:tRNA nucleotidyltransferase/poly(A) polymerase